MEDVQELVKQYGKEPEWFIGEMFCIKCQSIVKVRKDVYLKRLINGKKLEQSEEHVNRNYLCRKCSGGRSVKKDEYYKMVKESEE